ncbi:T9SS C-terminal target domain-containing protein [Chryseobacterium piperi]|uniref:M43 family zinc metalloprotease n=1 Tax=Chryseobacterium piperi TaxID=558152 RepID=UPI00068E0771|nr:M43 family zinc metalloprotease [Chryseobacterium piperi]ASW75787.1 T9SS C-terminal target domain-containing protein [Chryseobacterium piperi]
MRKSTTLKFLFLLPLFAAGVLNAQTPSRSVKKEAQFAKKSQEELAKANGFDRCSTVEYENYLKSKFPGRMTAEQFESWLAPLVEKARANKSQNGNIITIPVVVHVIHNGQNLGVAPNIVDEQVMSQITVMNNDYRRLAGTPGFNNNAVGADVQIQFALAKVDPKGNPTNGIDRVNLCQNSWSRDDIEAFVKPETIWDPTKYMNMWSLKFVDNTLLGYAQFPSASGLPGLNAQGGEAYSDGVVAKYSTFGSSDYNINNTFLLSAPYDKGRTMTHEVGHFLGLRHIWGDAACGNDFCDDTPTAHTSNYVCNPAIASCTNPSVFEMVQNYMDYTNDTCMNIFTINQKDRITTVMNNSPRRMELKTSTADQPIPLFPNDAEVKLERECATATCATTAAQSVKVSLYNRGTSPLTTAVITYSVNGNTKIYNWSGNLAQDKYQVVTLPMDANTLGGQMNINVTSVNGTTDQRVSNSNITVNYLGAIVRADANVVFNLQLDQYGSETSWALKNSSGATVYSGGPYTDSPNGSLPALKTINWTLNPNECYTLTVNDEFGDGFYPYGGYYNVKSQSGTTLLSGSHFASTQSRSLKVQVLGTNEVVKDNFGIYPNPVNDILNVTKVSNKANFEIHNAVGQLVKSGVITNNQIRVADLVKGTYIISIKDNAISESIKFIKK